MQPPRSRVRRPVFGSTPVIRELVLDATAAATTIFLLRLATLFLSDASDATIPRAIQILTEPAVWLFKLLPPLGSTVVQDATVSDILIVPLVALGGVLIAGVLTGWREVPAASRPHTGPYD